MLTPEEIQKVRSDAGVSPLNTSTNMPTTSLAERLGIQNAKKEPTLLEKVGGFAGDVVRDVTKPVVQSIAQVPMAADVIKQKIEGKKDIQAPTYDLPFYGKIEPPTSNEQVLGTAAKTTSLGLGPVAGGAAYFGGSAMQEDKSAKDVALSTAGGAALGKGLELAGQAFTKIPSTAWGALLKRTATSVAKNPELEKAISKEGIVGLSKKAIVQKLGSKIQETELQLSDLLSKTEGEVSTWNVVDKLRSLYDHYSNIPGEKDAQNKILEIGNSLLEKGSTMGVEAANQVKRDIYNVISNSYGKGLLEIPAKKEAQKALARGLKEEIEKVIPEAKDINAQQAIYIQAKNAIEKRMARETGKGVAGTGIGLFDLMVAGGGFMRGGIESGVGALIGKKLLESPGFQTTVASGTQKLVQMFDSIPPTAKMIMWNGIRGLADEGMKFFQTPTTKTNNK